MVTRARIACAGLCGLAVAAGCNFDTFGSNNPPPPGLGVQESTGEAPDPSTPSDDTDGAAGLSTTGASSGSGNDTNDPTVDPTDPTGDTSDAGTGGVSGTGGTTAPAGEDDGGLPVTEANLENTDLASCTDRVGCWGQIPAGPWTAVECFDSPVDPPYDVTNLRFVVGWITNSFDDLDIIVYERTASGLPGDVVWSGYMTNQPDEGMNDISFGMQAPTVNTPGFCLAFRVPDGGWDGGIEYATNTSAPVSDGSYYGNCGVTSWTGLGESWCIGARVEASP
jgi:hypothetical protein